MDKIKYDLEWFIRGNLTPKASLEWDGVKEAVNQILRITGHIPETKINYPIESETTGTDWVEQARSKTKEDENHLRQEAEENK